MAPGLRRLPAVVAVGVCAAASEPASQDWALEDVVSFIQVGTVHPKRELQGHKLSLKTTTREGGLGREQLRRWRTRTPAYVITLEDGHSRGENGSSHLQTSGSNRLREFLPNFGLLFPRMKIVPAIDGHDDLLLATLGAVSPALNRTGKHAGEIGCLLSHLKAVRQAWEDGAEVAAIFEDDARTDLAPFWQQSPDDLVASLPPYWSVFQTSMHAHQRHWRGLVELWAGTHTPWVQGSYWGTASYFISRHGMASLLQKYGVPFQGAFRVNADALVKCPVLDHNCGLFDDSAGSVFTATPSFFTDVPIAVPDPSNLSSSIDPTHASMHFRSMRAGLKFNQCSNRLRTEEGGCASGQQLLAHMQTAYDKSMRRLLRGVLRVVLFTIPASDDVGDLASLAGQMDYLRLRGIEVAHVCKRYGAGECTAAQIKRLLGGSRLSSAVLVQGGSGSARVEPRQEGRRARVVAGLGTLRVIFLPQSLATAQGKALARIERCMRRLPRAALCVRDAESLQLARQRLDGGGRGSRIQLVPDPSVWLARPVDPRLPDRTAFENKTVPVLSLTRKDLRQPYLGRREKVLWLTEQANKKKLALGHDIVVVGAEAAAQVAADLERWKTAGLRALEHPAGDLALAADARVERPFDLGAGETHEEMGHEEYADKETEAWGKSAQNRVQRGAWEVYAARQLGRVASILDRSGVVVTDSLHGHVLALVQGVPHVILDRPGGDARAYHRTWVRDRCDRHIATSSSWKGALRDAERLRQRLAVRVQRCSPPPEEQPESAPRTAPGR